jgi:hypothetical protein
MGRQETGVSYAFHQADRTSCLNPRVGHTGLKDGAWKCSQLSPHRTAPLADHGSGAFDAREPEEAEKVVVGGDPARAVPALVRQVASVG